MTWRAAALALFGAVAPAPVASLPMPASVPLVRVEVSAERVLVVEDVALPRGDWREGDLDLYVAFGAPGAPLALDAHLLAAPDGALDAADDAVGEPLALERAARRPASAHVLLGRPHMAGVVLHVADAALRRALAPGGMAIVRVRTLLPLPPQDARGGREIVARLGIHGDAPLTLGRVQVLAPDARPRVARADARFCGPDADPAPLAVALVPRPPAATASPPAPPVVAPVLAARHPTDDLCVRVYPQ